MSVVIAVGLYGDGMLIIDIRVRKDQLAVRRGRGGGIVGLGDNGEVYRRDLRRVVGAGHVDGDLPLDDAAVPVVHLDGEGFRSRLVRAEFLGGQRIRIADLAGISIDVADDQRAVSSCGTMIVVIAVGLHHDGMLHITDIRVRKEQRTVRLGRGGGIVGLGDGEFRICELDHRRVVGAGDGDSYDKIIRVGVPVVHLEDEVLISRLARTEFLGGQLVMIADLAVWLDAVDDQRAVLSYGADCAVVVVVLVTGPHHDGMRITFIRVRKDQRARLRERDGIVGLGDLEVLCSRDLRPVVGARKVYDELRLGRRAVVVRELQGEVFGGGYTFSQHVAGVRIGIAAVLLDDEGAVLSLNRGRPIVGEAYFLAVGVYSEAGHHAAAIIRVREAELARKRGIA